MGIKKGATEREIKKAFKKMAIRHHPDKNPDNPEKAKKKFAKIANAYETLSDPEKRRIYDAQGAEGVKTHEQRGGRGEEAHDPFAHFFGRGGGGGRHHQEEKKPDNLFDKTDVFSMEFSSFTKFYRRQEIWVIYFFTHDAKAEAFKTEYTTLCDKLYGIIKVAAVDCKAEEELCEEFAVYDYPTIQIYGENLADEGERYRGVMGSA
jgi:curved DNA-binding protein CbpA